MTSKSRTELLGDKIDVLSTKYVSKNRLVRVTSKCHEMKHSPEYPIDLLRKVNM